jgi:hypothetical protein
LIRSSGHLMTRISPAGGIVGFDLQTVLSAAQAIGMAAEEILRLMPALDLGLRDALDEMRQDDATLSAKPKD